MARVSPPPSEYAIKTALQCVAYLFLNGPWFNLWCRFGYNPRRHGAECKRLQSIVFTLRHHHLERLNDSVARLCEPIAKRHMGQVSVSYSLTKRRAANIAALTATGATKQRRLQTNDIDAACRFHPDEPLRARLLYLQLCDIDIVQVQEILHENDGAEPAVPTSDDGFLTTGAIARIMVEIREALDRASRSPLHADESGIINVSSHSQGTTDDITSSPLALERAGADESMQ